MYFRFSFANFVPNSQRRRQRAGSLQTLIPTNNILPVSSSSNVPSAIAALRSVWRGFISVLDGSLPQNPLPFKATRSAPCYIVLLHLVPVAAVAVIISFNLYGYWIGKELSGINNQNAPKELALQLTAKVHELLMLASLSEILLTHLLKRLATGYGLPFGSLTAGSKFKDLSYMWSKDFRVLCTAGYPHKAVVIPLVLICTMFGLVIGPSSATALIPRLDVWPAGKAVMILNTSSDLLWPSTMKASAAAPKTCDNTTLGCPSPLAWDSVAANLFTYFGHTTAGSGAFSPQHVNVPGISSLRNLDIRLRGSISPDFTVATVQHAVLADMVNTFRFLTFPSRSRKCRKTWSRAMCSYQDASWYVDAKQPVVVTACLKSELNASTIRFPIISNALTSLTTSIALNTTFRSDNTHPQLQWLSPSESQSLNASIGAVVQLGTSNNATNFACTIEGQWTKSTTSTNFTGTDYLISSVVPGLESSTLVKKGRKAQTVTFDSVLAQQIVDTPMSFENNSTTALERFLSLGEAGRDASVQLEAALSVLFAESMAHTGSGPIPLSITSRDLSLKKQGSLVKDPNFQATQLTTPFILKTSMTGYGYGLYTTSGLSTSTLISIILLGMYATFAMVHLLSLCVSRYPYVIWGRDEREILVACLFSSLRPRVLRMHNGESAGTNGEESVDIEAESVLGDIVILTGTDGRAELLFRGRDWPDDDIPLVSGSMNE